MNTCAPPHRQLHADTLAAALRSGVYRVIAEQEFLNKINVFPVADGDTGTNLSVSLGATLGLLGDAGGRHAGKLLIALADAMLDGARGNSGAILAQFFQGMSDAVGHLESLDPQSFTDAVGTGSDYAHDALADPREGTILTVIREFAGGLRGRLDERGAAGFPEILRVAVEATRNALENTTMQLEVLRAAGVVDAGAHGFLVLIEGMVDFISDGREVGAPDAARLFASAAVVETAGEAVDLEYRYCTECIVTGEGIDRRKLREALAEVGDSLVLAGTLRKARIHIHTDAPDRVFGVADRFGHVSGQKADDMHRQQHGTHAIRAGYAVITDSAADVPDADMERLDIHMVPVRVQFGERGYLDKVSITTDEFFRQLETSPVHPTSSQPAPGDFRRQYQFLASHYPHVISVNLTPGVSGTFQAAESAASRIDAPGRVHVVDSRNVSLGQGLLAVYAAECALAGLSVEDALRALRAMIPLTRSFALLRDLRFAVRGGRVAPSVKRLADLLRVTPVLATTADGGIRPQGVLLGRGGRLPKFARFIARRMAGKHRPERPLRIAVGHALCAEEAVELERLLRSLLPRIVKSGITSIGSALGVHGGPGTLVVGVQEYRDPSEFRRPGPAPDPRR